uniref:Uncharacterized protein n=1 Tax=Odontella aurita TaxID=265563 RepID=A0A7S4JQF0_9STRA|mmetsp:Transcript_51786/g.155400  ORF Transcript_51786/g.155400 Transcript_51786/m.155400 type:complete len:171 (+) Transcript_51786:915-1427(+)
MVRLSLSNLQKVILSQQLRKQGGAIQLTCPLVKYPVYSIATMSPCLGRAAPLGAGPVTAYLTPDGVLKISGAARAGDEAARVEAAATVDAAAVERKVRRDERAGVCCRADMDRAVADGTRASARREMDRILTVGSFDLFSKFLPFNDYGNLAKSCTMRCNAYLSSRLLVQ